MREENKYAHTHDSFAPSEQDRHTSNQPQPASQIDRLTDRGPVRLGELGGLHVNLRGQLPRRRQDQDDGAVACVGDKRGGTVTVVRVRGVL